MTRLWVVSGHGYLNKNQSQLINLNSKKIYFYVDHGEILESNNKGQGLGWDLYRKLKSIKFESQSSTISEVLNHSRVLISGEQSFNYTVRGLSDNEKQSNNFWAGIFEIEEGFVPRDITPIGNSNTHIIYENNYSYREIVKYDNENKRNTISDIINAHNCPEKIVWLACRSVIS